MSQNAARCFLLDIAFLQIFRIDLWWNLGIFFRKKHHKPILRFGGSHRSRPRLALSAGRGNKTIFCPALIGCFRREMTSPDRLVQIHCFCASWTPDPPHFSMIGDMKASCVSMSSASAPVHKIYFHGLCL